MDSRLARFPLGTAEIAKVDGLLLVFAGSKNCPMHTATNDKVSIPFRLPNPNPTIWIATLIRKLISRATRKAAGEHFMR
jgi:hypothetical protein